MNKEALFHQANSVWSYIEDKSVVTLLFRSSVKDTLTIETVEYNRFYDYRKRLFHPMHKYLADDLFQYYLVSFVPNHYGCVYYFKITEGKECWYYNEYGLQSEEPIRLGNYEIPRIQETDVYQAPDFVKEAVFYQIFPDRFHRVGPVEGSLEQWGNPPTYYNKFGGNFRGITEKIPYLCQLGINAIYFTPVNYSHSSHRYDTIDYLKIDPLLGGEEAFAELVGACHKQGIKVVVDLVFNHSSSDFFAFEDVLRFQEKSKYKDWFLIDSFPVKVQAEKTYQTFGHEPHMPKLNSINPEVRDYLIKVARFYLLQFHVDGFRLDVADEVDSDFWRLFRHEVKALNPQAIIIGEVWHNSDYYLRGDLFDSVQNYQFYEVMNRFFVRKVTSLASFRNEITRLLVMYPRNVQRALLNQVDSHDTPRILSMLHANTSLLMNVILFQFCFVGMPCVYYGDEVGMEGMQDPDNRRCYPWGEDKLNKEILTFFQEVIAFRKSEAVLQTGDFRFTKVHPTLLTFERYFEDQSIEIWMNPSDQMINLNHREVEVLAPYAMIIFKHQDGNTTVMKKWGK